MPVRVAETSKDLAPPTSTRTMAAYPLSYRAVAA